MTKMKLIVSMLSVFAAFTFFASSAQAQTFAKTYVSNSGSNSSPNCGNSSPCRTFTAAIAKTWAGGEIIVLDSGEYGSFTITKALTINGDGSTAEITASSFGISINAGANDVVTIRGVSINGLGGLAGGTGIRYQSGKQVLVENCSITGLAFNGIEVALSAPGNLVVKNTTIQGVSNGSNVQNGIKQTTADGALNAVLEDVRIVGNFNGVELVNGSVTLSNSLVSQNSNIGILAGGGTINIESSTMASNAVGVQANTGTTIRLSNVDILNNNTGISILPGGTVASFGNNRIAGNTTPGAPNQLLSQQ